MDGISFHTGNGTCSQEWKMHVIKFSKGIDYVSTLTMAEWWGCTDGRDIKNQRPDKNTIYTYLSFVRKATLCRQK